MIMSRKTLNVFLLALSVLGVVKANELPTRWYEMGSNPKEGMSLNNANWCRVRFQSQLRLFEYAELYYTRPRDRLYKIHLGGIKEDIAYDSALEELKKVKQIVERTLKVQLGEISTTPKHREASCSGRGRGLNIRLWINGQPNHGNGFWLTIESETVKQEEKALSEANAKKFSIPL